MDALAGFILALVLLGVIGYGIYNIAVENALFFWMTIGGVAAIITAVVVARRKKEVAKYDALPEYGPMRISMETSEGSSGQQYLLLKATISKHDWNTIE